MLSKMQLVQTITDYSNYNQIHVIDTISQILHKQLEIKSSYDFNDLYNIIWNLSDYITEDLNPYCYNFEPKI